MSTVNGIKVTYLDTEESLQDKIMSRAEVDVLNTVIASSARELLTSGPGDYDDVDIGDDETEAVVEMFRMNVRQRELRQRQVIESLGDEPPEINTSNIAEVSAENQITIKTDFAHVLFQKIELSSEVPLIVSHNNLMRVHDTIVESLSKIDDVSQILDPKTNMFSFLIKTVDEITYAPTKKLNTDDYIIVDVAFPVEKDVDEMDESEVDVTFTPPGHVKATETISKRIQETLDISDDVRSYVPMKKKSLELFYLYEDAPEINSAILDFMIMNDEVMSTLYVITGYKKSKNAITLKFKDTGEKVKIVQVQRKEGGLEEESKENTQSRGRSQSRSIGIYYFAENNFRRESILQKIIASLEYYKKKESGVETLLNSINNKVLRGFSLNDVSGYKSKKSEERIEIGSNVAVKKFREKMADQSVAVGISNNPLLSAKSCKDVLSAETAELDISHWVYALQTVAESRIFTFSFDGTMILPNLSGGYYKPQAEYKKCILLFVNEDSAVNVIVDARFTNTGYVKSDTAILNDGNVGKLPQVFEPLFGPSFFRLGVKDGYSRNKVIQGVVRALKNSKFKTTFERNSEVFKATNSVFSKNIAFYSGNEIGNMNRTLKNIDLDNVEYQGVDGHGNLRLVGFAVGDNIVDIFLKPQAPLATVDTVDLEKHQVQIADEQTLKELMTTFKIKWNVSKYPGKALFKITSDQYAYVLTSTNPKFDKLDKLKQKKRVERLLSQICLFRFSEFLTDQNEDAYDVNDEMIEMFMQNETYEEKNDEYKYDFYTFLEDNFQDEKIKIPKNSTEAFKFFLKNKSTDPLFVRTFKYSKYLDDYFENGVRRNGDVYFMPLHAFPTWIGSRQNNKNVFHTKPVLTSPSDVASPYYLSIQNKLYYSQNFNSEDAALSYIENQKIYDPSKFTFSGNKGFEPFLEASQDAVVVGFNTTEGESVYVAGIVPQFKL